MEITVSPLVGKVKKITEVRFLEVGYHAECLKRVNEDVSGQVGPSESYVDGQELVH
jgi:hypothetical protein